MTERLPWNSSGLALREKLVMGLALGQKPKVLSFSKDHVMRMQSLLASQLLLMVPIRGHLWAYDSHSQLQDEGG
jgi:hypothetical protein